MFLLAVFLSTLITLVLYVAGDSPLLTVGNNARCRSAARLFAHLIVWAILLQAFLSWLLPSPWS